MTEHITIRNAPGKWVVRADGAVIGETDRALELTEGSYAPVIYFPRDDIGMAFLEQTAKSSHCPHKGDATYFTISTTGEELTNAAWSYEAPKAGVEQIQDHLAFFTDRVAIEQL